MKAKLLVLTCTLLAMGAAHGADETGSLDLSVGYVSAPERKADLEQSLSQANGGMAVSCSDVVTVPTGGRMGQATAGRCRFGDKEPVWACQNDLVGNTARQEFRDYNVSEGFALTRLIVTHCSGG